eukprot:GHVU01192647.1.p2 GENE.GHVU01192647.1~~GHVU01192647.1.p2  ORF type:complete len:119 (-),score=7.46 GHVU01192647.1:1169-1525(-)
MESTRQAHSRKRLNSGRIAHSSPRSTGLHRKNDGERRNAKIKAVLTQGLKHQSKGLTRTELLRFELFGGCMVEGRVEWPLRNRHNCVLSQYAEKATTAADTRQEVTHACTWSWVAPSM